MAFGALGVISDVVQASDPKTLQDRISASFARQLLDDPDSQFIELQLAGGGAGAVFQVTLFYSTSELGNYPPLSVQNVRVFGAPDPTTMRAKLADFYDTTDVDRTTFVEKGSGGAGAYWIDIIVYTLDEESILSAMVDVEEVAAVIPAPAATPEELANAEIRRRVRVAKRAARPKALGVIPVLGAEWPAREIAPAALPELSVLTREEQVSADRRRRARVQRRREVRTKGK